MKRILFVRPLVEFPVSEVQELGIPQSYLHLAQYLMENSDGDVSIADYRLKKMLDQEIDPRKDFSAFDVIAIGCSTNEFPPAINLFSVAKELGKITVLGGIFPAQNRNYCLDHREVDYVVSGEGEQVLSELLNVIGGGISDDKLSLINGLSFTNSLGMAVCNKRGRLLKHIPELKLETYSLLNLEDYAKFIPAHLMATRGCPCGCSFCSLKSLWNRTYRKRPVENVVREMRFLRDKGFRRIHLKDETITADYTYAKALFMEIIKEGLDVGIKVKSRIDGIRDDELLFLMREAGVDCIHFGVETISDDLLARIGKGGLINSKMIQSVLDRVLGYNIRINPVFLIGIPEQEERDLDLLASFVEALGKEPKVIAYCSFWNPHPIDGEYSIDDEMVLLTKDLNRFTHKQPVSVSISLDTFGGRKKMLEAFDFISEITGNRRVNPMIESSYRDFFLNAAGCDCNKVPLVKNGE